MKFPLVFIRTPPPSPTYINPLKPYYSMCAKVAIDTVVAVVDEDHLAEAPTMSVVEEIRATGYQAAR